MTISAIELILIIAVIALIIFMTMRKSMTNRNINKHERLKEKQEELLQMLHKKEDEEPGSV